MDNLPFEKKKKKKFGSDAISQASQDQKQSFDYLYSLPTHPQTAPAVATAIQAGADPKVLNKAKSMLGNQDFIGLCEKFVEQVTGMPQKFASAFADWQANKNKAIPLSQAKPGDKIFFAPDASNSGYGHTGVITGPDSMISATSSGVKKSSISKWVSEVGQKVLGVIPG